VAIAAGRYHSLALKADGTVVAWGDNRLGQNNMPAGLNGVVAISARIYDSMALKSGGTVVTWGYYSSYYAVPAGLNNVVAIATGGSHFLALRSDGSIVAWGDNGFGQTAVPGTLVPDHNIQDAVNAAHDGDTVLVAPGEYNLVNQITITKAITVRSTASPGQTFLNSRSNIWCLWISNSLAVADGFTLQNPERVSQTAQAGGAFIVGGTVQNCLITNFSLSRIGSAVIVKGGTLRNSIVPYRSEAPGSSAAYCTDDGLITGCQIVGSSGGPNRSMAVYLENGRLQYSLVSGDFYVSNSGEVAVKALSSTITGCTIMNNFNLGQGGGAYLENSVMDRCIVTGNGCGTGGGRGSGGGGVFATNSLIRDSLIASNRVFMSSAEPTAGGYGGGVYMQGGALVNCTVSGNIADDFGSAPGAGGGVYAESAGVTNSIIYFNTLRTGSAGSNWFGFGPTTFDHCCTAPDPGGAGNITQDPQFLDASNGDFHPASTSPCINAGVTQPWMIGAYDLDGNPRVSGTSVDIGAYETPATTRQDLAEALMAEVNSLVADGILSHGHGNSLLASLRPALNNMNRGNTETACGQVGAFIGKVQQFTAAGELSQGDGSALIGAASDLQTALGCGGQTNSGQQKAPARRSFSPR
jgi:hypothetical protein